MEWLAEHAWVVWVSLAALLGVAELLTLDFTLLMLAAGALAGGVVALFVPILWVQIAAAVVIAVSMLALLRPTLLRKVRALPGYRNSMDKMVGSPGTAMTEITAGGGEVKVAGEIWSAHSVEGIIPAGTEVEVYRVDGAIAIVYPRNLALP